MKSLPSVAKTHITPSDAKRWDNLISVINIRAYYFYFFPDVITLRLSFSVHAADGRIHNQTFVQHQNHSHSNNCICKHDRRVENKSNAQQWRYEPKIESDEICTNSFWRFIGMWCVTCCACAHLRYRFLILNHQSIHRFGGWVRSTIHLFSSATYSKCNATLNSGVWYDRFALFINDNLRLLKSLVCYMQITM